MYYHVSKHVKIAKPYDFTQLFKRVSTSEVELFTTPSDKYRCVYAIILHDLSGTTTASNNITFRIYREDGTTLDKEFTIPLTAYETKVITLGEKIPVITLQPSYVLKALTSVGDVEVELVFKDE